MYHQSGFQVAALLDFRELLILVTQIELTLGNISGMTLLPSDSGTNLGEHEEKVAER